ncbi:LysE family transporter [Bacteroidota bacterium]
MILDYFIFLLIGISTSVVGAVPFGLVNLTVLNVSLEQGNRAARRIAHGASVVEVLFGLTAILAGSMVYQYLEGNSVISFIAIAVLIVGGLFFLLKKQRLENPQETSYSGFLKGAILNLVSVQVFLFWILAIAFLSSIELMKYDALSVLIFISGIWMGKMLVLQLYMKLSRRLLSKSRVISMNINRIIGFVLFGMAFVQFINM